MKMTPTKLELVALHLLDTGLAGNFWRLLSSLFASLIRFESTYVNWDMLIGIAEDENLQYWHSLAGDEKSKKRAVFHNIYKSNGIGVEGRTNRRLSNYVN